MPDRFLRTDRLLLRPWRASDLAPFAAMNADPAVMEYFSKPLTRTESDAQATAFSGLLNRQRYGLWAVEAPGVAPFVGFVGLNHVVFEAAFTPCVEVGWRLAREHWGRGYATEAARAALRRGFELPGVGEIVAFTVPENVRSRAVMERLGMARDPAEDFDHPALPEGHRLRRHVLYRIRREASATPRPSTTPGPAFDASDKCRLPPCRPSPRDLPSPSCTPDRRSGRPAAIRKAEHPWDPPPRSDATRAAPGPASR